MTNKENFNQIGSIIVDFEENCNPDFQNIIDVFWDRGADGNEIVHEIHVEIEDAGKAMSFQNTYCYPVAEFGRERGLYLWDTVTNWEDKTVTLRFRFEE